MLKNRGYDFMFYELEVKSHVRVPPNLFGEETKTAILKQLTEKFDNFISKELGAVIAVTEIGEVGDGIIIPGDGAAYYDSTFKILTFIPDMQEVVLGKINEITDFGAFMDLGALDGMIHVSQAMDDFVSFSKSNVLTGKETKKVLKVNDICRARIIAVSYKELSNPKIGLTMRQSELGALSWIKEEANRRRKEEEKFDDVEEVKEKKK